MESVDVIVQSSNASQSHMVGGILKDPQKFINFAGEQQVAERILRLALLLNEGIVTV